MDEEQLSRLGGIPSTAKLHGEIMYTLGRIDQKLDDMERKIDKLIQAEKERRGYPPEQHAPPHLNPPGD